MSHGLLAMRTEAAGADPTAEGLAIGAVLLAEVSGLAEWACVDDTGTRGAGKHDGHVVGLGVMAEAEGFLPTGIRTPTLAASWMKRAGADRAGGGLDHRYGVVTRRESRVEPDTRSWAGREPVDVLLMEPPWGLTEDVKP